MKFITIVYPPTDNAGIDPSAPASEHDKGSDEITLLPKSDLIHRTTPNVIRNSETINNKCCHTKPTARFLEGIQNVIDILYLIFFAKLQISIYMQDHLNPLL